MNPGNSATRYVHPETGRSVVLDDVTREVIHVGGEGFDPRGAPGVSRELPDHQASVGLDDLEFLPAGDALLSRRVKAKSTKWAVVVRFSRTRRRYERQGLLIEPPAFAEVQRELGARRE